MGFGPWISAGGSRQVDLVVEIAADRIAKPGLLTQIA